METEPVELGIAGLGTAESGLLDHRNAQDAKTESEQRYG